MIHIGDGEAVPSLSTRRQRPARGSSLKTKRATATKISREEAWESTRAFLRKHKNSRQPARPEAAEKLCERKTRVPWFFVHLHKSGGTTLCGLAQANGWCVPRAKVEKDIGSYFGKNCNPSIADMKPALWSSGLKATKHALVQGWDFWATEWFVAYQLPVRVKIVVMMRDPAARAFSHCAGHAKNNTRFEECVLKPGKLGVALKVFLY